MKNYIIGLLVMVLPCLVHGQQYGKISGQVADAHSKQPLEGATISVLNKQSGIFINYGVSGRKGEFQVGALPEGVAMDVLISFKGYRDTSSSFTLDAGTKVLATGVWLLDTTAQEMEAVTVTARRAPFVVRNDTLEFNASAFKSLPTDMVQDLLRKLPGMGVDAQGNVTVNGKKVDKIQVDGREFFSGNLKVAMENLPGSIIDKVQVMDSRQRGTEHNSLIAPISKTVTMNLTLKADKKSGSFGDVWAGAGTGKQYTANGFYNYFQNDRRVSLTGSTANMSGTGSGLGGLQTGGGLLTKASTGAVNLNDRLGRKGTIDMSYSVNSRRQPSETVTERTNILPDSSFLYNSSSRKTASNLTHTVTSNYQLPMDSLQSLSVITTLSFTNTRNDAQMDAASTTLAGGWINEQNNHNINTDHSFSLNNQVTYLLASRNHARNLSVNWGMDMQQRNGRRLNQSENRYYVPEYRVDSLNQHGLDKGNGWNNNLLVNLSQALGGKVLAIVNYAWLQNIDKADLDVYNCDAVSDKYALLDSLYSNHNRNANQTHLFSGSIGYRAGKWVVEGGAVYRIIDQQNKLVWKDSTIRVKQQNVAPRLSVSYPISKNSRINTTYSAELTAPTTEQLSPVQDNTNPLYIKVGNPYLRSSLTHNVNLELQYYTHDYKWQASLQGTGAFIRNQLTEDTYYDSLGRQISSFQNVNGARNISMRAGGTSLLKFGSWSGTINLVADLSANRDISLVNRQLNTGSTIDFTPQLSMTLLWKDKVTVGASGSVQQHTTAYTLEGVADVKYQVKRAQLSARVVPAKRLIISSSVNYLLNEQLPADFQRSRTLVNGQVSYILLKNEQLRISVSVNDLLNDNMNIRRSITPTAIQTTQTATMRRYGMLTVQYRFNHFGVGRGN